MDYQQSLKNIESLKNLVLPLEAHQVFFDFSNDTNFKMVLLTTSESKKLSELVRRKYISKIPTCFIFIDNQEHEIFYYEDKFIRYSFNLTINQILMHDCKQFFKNQTSAELANQINKLILRLKNM